MKIVALLVAGLILFAAPKADAEVIPASAPAARVFADGFLTAFNNGREVDYETYLRDHWLGLKDAREYADMRAQTGGHDVVQVLNATGTLEVEVVKARLSDDYATFRLETDASPTPSIKTLIFTDSTRPLDVPPPKRLTAFQVGREVDQHSRWATFRERC